MTVQEHTLQEQEDVQKGNIDFFVTHHHERLPLLEEVLRRFAEQITLNTLPLSDVILKRFTIKRFGDFMKPLTQMVGVFDICEWKGRGLFVLERDFSFLLISNLLGDNWAQNNEEKPYTPIECHLIQGILQYLTKDLAQAFSIVSSLEIDFERIETNPQLAPITYDNDSVIVAEFLVTLNQRTGVMQLVLPYSTLEPVRDLLLENYKGEQVWEDYLTAKLHQTELELEVLFKEQFISLSQILNWQVGSELLLKVTAQDDLILRCKNHILGYGKMGQKSGNIALKLEDFKKEDIL